MTYNFSDEIGSPGMGITPIKLSKDPLATEGEATNGPDDTVDFEEIDRADLGLADVPGFEPRDFPDEEFGFDPLDFDESGFTFDPPRF